MQDRVRTLETPGIRPCGNRFILVTMCRSTLGRQGGSIRSDSQFPVSRKFARIVSEWASYALANLSIVRLLSCFRCAAAAWL
jgi:hypothetical protein